MQGSRGRGRGGGRAEQWPPVEAAVEHPDVNGWSAGELGPVHRGVRAVTQAPTCPAHDSIFGDSHAPAGAQARALGRSQPPALPPALPGSQQHCPAGARWDTQTGVIAEARLKELTPAMPVIFIKAIPVDRMETKNIYECPVYKTRMRGPTYVWTFNLKTKEKASKWVLAAVALLLQV